MSRLFPVAACAFACAVFSGCGGSSLGCVPVSGKVQFADGTTLAGYQIKKIALDPTGADGHRATGDIGEDGSFVLMTKLPADGAIPGKYVVSANIYKNYPPTQADLTAKWSFEPAEVEVTDSMDQLVITLKKN